MRLMGRKHGRARTSHHFVLFIYLFLAASWLLLPRTCREVYAFMHSWHSSDAKRGVDIFAAGAFVSVCWWWGERSGGWWGQGCRRGWGWREGSERELSKFSSQLLAEHGAPGTLINVASPTAPHSGPAQLSVDQCLLFKWKRLSLSTSIAFRRKRFQHGKRMKYHKCCSYHARPLGGGVLVCCNGTQQTFPASGTVQPLISRF